MTDIPSQSRIRVWDVPVRVFHWGLVALVSMALVTGFMGSGAGFDLHVLSGSAIAALVAARLIWGFTGTTYARFASFVVSPVAALRHVAGIRRGERAGHVGHNPVGGWMILALLATLALLVVTGTLALGGVLKEGPLAPFLSYANGSVARAAHESIAFGLMALVALHVLGIVTESLRTRDNLVGAMLRGWKPVRADAHGAAPARARPRLAAFLVVTIVSATWAAVNGLARLPVPGVPVAPLDPVYAKECGSCHSAHHPSVATAATWSALMAGLDSHFGDNASLDEPLRSAIATYLAANAAGKWDTRAAHSLAAAAASEPLRITATRGWRRLHGHVPGAAFDRRSVGGKLNCSRCHGDAELGRFHPRAIAIPEETTSQ